MRMSARSIKLAIGAALAVLVVGGSTAFAISNDRSVKGIKSLGVYDAKGRFVGSVLSGSPGAPATVFVQVGSTPVLAYVTRDAIYGDESGSSFYYESEDCTGPAMYPADAAAEGDYLFRPVRWHGSRIYEIGPTRTTQLRSWSSEWGGCQPIDWLPDEVEAGDAQLLADLSTHFQAPFRLRTVE